MSRGRCDECGRVNTTVRVFEDWAGRPFLLCAVCRAPTERESAAIARAERAEAENARLRGALKEITRVYGDGFLVCSIAAAALDHTEPAGEENRLPAG